MIETQGIIYKCQHCDYVSANKNQTKIHEEIDGEIQEI